METLAFYKLLSDDTRLKTSMLLLQHGELCVCELVEVLEISQPKVSRHLAQLRDAGVLQTSRRGQWIYYRLADTLPPWCLQMLRISTDASVQYLHQANTTLENMSDRPACR